MISIHCISFAFKRFNLWVIGFYLIFGAGLLVYRNSCSFFFFLPRLKTWNSPFKLGSKCPAKGIWWMAGWASWEMLIMCCIKPLKVTGPLLHTGWTGTTGSTQTDKAVAEHSVGQSSTELLHIFSETKMSLRLRGPGNRKNNHMRDKGACRSWLCS